MSSALLPFPVWLVVLLALQTTTGVSGCSVTPSAAAVVAGDDLSLTCTARDQSELIDMWKLGNDSAKAKVLYQAPSYNRNGSIRVERKVADGYLVDDSNSERVIFTINNTSIDEDDYYYCICTGSTQSSDSAFVSVLASEPTFSNTTEITDGEPVIFACSISFSGLGNLSITTEDSFGRNLNTSNYAVTSRGLHSFSLDYSTTANSSISQEYSCNITLTSGSSRNIIYTTRVNSSVQWVSVQNVQIRPVDKTRCLHGEQCAINQTVRCTAEGNPKPVTFQWLASINGSEWTMNETNGDNFTFSTVGNNTVQCIAYNEFIGSRYSSSSSIFTTEVVVNGPYYNPEERESQSNGTDTTPIIVGVVVGVGGFIIIVAVIVLFLYCKRKKSRTGCFNHEDEGTKNIESVQLSTNHASSKSVNTDKIIGLKNNVHVTAGTQNNSFDKNLSDETTVVENELYAGKPSNIRIDPSDGGYASLNEVQPNKR